MTLGIVLQAKDKTVVIVSDKRVSTDSTHGDFVQKIYRVTDRCGLTISGDGGTAVVIIDLFLKRINTEFKDSHETLSITEIAEIFRCVAVEFYTQWFKDMSIQEWVANVRSDVIPFFRVLLAGFDINTDESLTEPKIIEISSLRRFAPVSVTTDFGTIGITTIANYLLYRFYQEDQDELAVAGLAGFCIQETSSQDGSVGEEFQVASFSDARPFRYYNAAELEKIKKRCAELKTDMQTALFLPSGIKE